MTQEHPITPSTELVKQWLGTYFGTTITGEVSDVELTLATQAARWGADQELEACCHEAQKLYGVGRWLRSIRRPESLKAQALALLDDASDQLDAAHENTIRRALEQLND